MELITIEQDVQRDIAVQGFAWIPHPAWSISPQLEPHWQRLREDWDDLELDQYLLGEAKFRLRRYGRYYWSPATNALVVLPTEPYFQTEDENPYAGGIARAFAPLLPDTVHNPFLHALVRATFACLPIAITSARKNPTSPERQRRGPVAGAPGLCEPLACRGNTDSQVATWEVRIHQLRIVASPKVPGLPAPEGIHQDGTDFLTLHLVRRHNVEGAESTIYDLDRKPIQRFTLRETLDSLILEDPRIMHGVTPVESADGNSLAIRDLLGIDFIYCPQLKRPV